MLKFKASPDSKKLTELSLKQRQQYILYIRDNHERAWPSLPPRSGTPFPFVEEAFRNVGRKPE